MIFPDTRPAPTDEAVTQLRMCNDLVELLASPGWLHIDRHIAEDRQAALDSLRAAKGNVSILGEATLRWQIIDSVYSSIEAFIRDAIQQGNEAAQTLNLDEELLKEQMHGRSNASSDPRTDSASY